MRERENIQSYQTNKIKYSVHPTIF